MPTILDVSRNGYGIAVLTACNAESTIVDIVNRLITIGLHTIVVDDASTDHTARDARLTGADVVVNRSRLGLGKSLLYAWQLALDNRPDYVVQVDGRADSVLNMIEATERVDLALGCRNAQSWSSRFVAGACNAIQPRKHADWLCGNRVFRADLLSALLRFGYGASGQLWHAEVLARCNQLGCQVASLPVGGILRPLTVKDWREVPGAWLRILSIPVPTSKVVELESPW
jgi:glycosyltransferase involved in cell wall biosynthesis